MAGAQEYVPSLWDRLFDPYGDLRVSSRYDVDTYRRSVARDLEMLLNTSCVTGETVRDMGYPQAAQSVVCFGHPGLPVGDLASRERVVALQTWYASVIEEFDRRLTNVRVELDIDPRWAAGYRGKAPPLGAHSKHLRIAADLRLPPDRTLDVEFDAEVQSTDLQHRITSKG